jgi:hypothetical protein
MADLKTRDLPATTTLQDTDLVEVSVDDLGGGFDSEHIVVSDLKTELNVGVLQDFYVDAAAMAPATTDGAEANTEEYVVTPALTVDQLLFDTTTEEFAHFKVQMPSRWDLGTIKFKAFWSADAGTPASDTVAWKLAAQAVSDDDPIDPGGSIAGSATVVDTLLATDDLHVTDAGTVTVDGTPALHDMIFFVVSRDVAADILASDAKLLGIAIQYTESDTQPTAWS